jgi:hypothetical protein
LVGAFVEIPAEEGRWGREGVGDGEDYGNQRAICVYIQNSEKDIHYRFADNCTLMNHGSKPAQTSHMIAVSDPWF